MGYDDYDDDYAVRQTQKKEKQEKAKQRKVVRYQDLTDDEIRKQGGELLSKIVAAIPKHFNKPGAAAGRYSGRKEGIIFIAVEKGSKETKQVIRISLALRPSVVVDYVVGAFKTKGWDAKHTFSDLEGYDFLDLSLPEDWLKRVLCIGRYNQKLTEEPTPASVPEPTPAPEQPKEETPDRMNYLEEDTPAP